jgi:hypothetical protein
MKKLSKKDLIKFKKGPFDNFLTKFAVFVAILLVVGGGIGMILVQKELQQSQDSRQQAYVEGGQVTIIAEGADSQIDQETKFIFKIKTGSVLTEGARLTFNVITDAFTDLPEFRSINSSLSADPSNAIEQTADGFLISASFLPTAGTSFPPDQNTAALTGDSFISFAELVFTPTSAGNVVLNFDNENSSSPEYNGATDELLQIAEASLIVTGEEEEETPACSYTYSDWSTCTDDQQTRTVATQTPDDCTGTPDLTQSCTSEEENEEEEHEEEENDDDDDDDDDDDSGIGGTDLSSCNESCSSNDDCIANHRCYNDECRLATNVSSSTCSAPADMGLNFSCNEYCADSNECSSDLTCTENKCRNPENLTSTTCADLTIVQRETLVSSCNESCSINNDCDVNLRCYKGACRLATNPSSFSCSPKSKTSLSESLYGAKTKGDKTDAEIMISKKDPVESEEDLIAQKGAQTALNSQEMDQKDKEETALDFVKNWFIENPQLPLILIGSGLAIIVFIIIVAILKSIGSNRKPPTPGGGVGSMDNQAQQDLQNRINSLKNAPASDPSTLTQTPPPPMPPQMSPPSTPPGFNSKPTSNMMNKVRAKDISQPSL